jgi:hypothetical protein
MRIITGRDYYDTAMAFGRDDTIIHVREKEHLVKVEDFPCPYRHGNYFFDSLDGKAIIEEWRTSTYFVKGQIFNAGEAIVIFCGKLHRGVAVTFGDGRRVYYWQKARFVEWLNSMGLKMARSVLERRVNLLNEAFQGSEVTGALLHYLVSNRIVTAIRNPGLAKWLINSDQLKTVQFFKVYDPYAAFQEISMWIGGVLPANGNAMVQISDKDRIEKHGFDNKTSFRKMKNGKTR